MEEKIKNIIGLILQIPLLLVIFVSFFASLYLVIFPVNGIKISFAVPIIFALLIISYFIGIFLRKKRY